MSKIYKKQPLDIVVSGITLRYSMKYNIWVNWAGTRAYRKYNDSSWNRFLQIHTDINGSKFLNVKPKTASSPHLRPRRFHVDNSGYHKYR